MPAEFYLRVIPLKQCYLESKCKKDKAMFILINLKTISTNIQKSYDFMEFSLEYYFRLGLQNEIDYSHVRITKNVTVEESLIL